MATTLESGPTATTLDVEALVNMAWAGKIRVPHFQRDFRWGWEDVRRLFDSIEKGYPIGSLLLWQREAPAQTLQLGALQIRAPKTDNALWVVDGQQRLTSLANALHNDGAAKAEFALAYDLRQDQEGFVRTPATDDPLIIPLPVLFNLQLLLRWFSEHSEISEYLDQATSVTRRIRQFEVPAYKVSQEDPRVLQDIFDRMNNYGKRLSRAEVFSALNAGDESLREESITFNRIAERIDVDYGFGTLDNDTVLGAVLARRGPEVRRDIRSEFASDGDEGRDAAYEAGDAALRRAVLFLQEEAAVPHVALLAYRYLLVVLARLFALYPEPDQRNSQLLRRWYWRAAVAGPERFKGGTPNAARVLCGKITRQSLSRSVQDLLTAVDLRDPTIPDLRRFATNEAATKMVLCSWWANGPRNPMNTDRYELAELAESLTDRKTARDAVHYLVPRRSIPEECRVWAANRAMMPLLEVDAKEVSDLIVRPSFDLRVPDWHAMLESHVISPAMSLALASGDVGTFIRARQEALEKDIRRFLRRMCEWGFEDTPPLSSYLMEDEGDDADE